MMSSQYPIWNQINSCIYADKHGSTGNKSYGVRQHGDVTIYVGTSAKNSHKFLTHSVTHRAHSNGDREFRFHVNGEVLATGLLPKGATELVFETNTLFGGAFISGSEDHAD